MTKFEQLLKRTDLSPEEHARMIKDVMERYLREEEIAIVRMIMGIGCHPNTPEEIEDFIGYEKEVVIQKFNKAMYKLEELL